MNRTSIETCKSWSRRSWRSRSATWSWISAVWRMIRLMRQVERRDRADRLGGVEAALHRRRTRHPCRSCRRRFEPVPIVDLPGAGGDRRGDQLDQAGSDRRVGRSPELGCRTASAHRRAAGGEGGRAVRHRHRRHRVLPLRAGRLRVGRGWRARGRRCSCAAAASPGRPRSTSCGIVESTDACGLVISSTSSSTL